MCPVGRLYFTHDDLQAICSYYLLVRETPRLLSNCWSDERSFKGKVVCQTVRLIYLLLAWQNYLMLIGWKEYNYFINCTAIQLTIFPKQTKWRKGILNTNVKWNCPRRTRLKYEPKSTKFCFNRRTKWKCGQKHQILVESLAGLGFSGRICCWHWEVSNFVMLIINK